VVEMRTRLVPRTAAAATAFTFAIAIAVAVVAVPVAVVVMVVMITGELPTVPSGAATRPAAGTIEGSLRLSAGLGQLPDGGALPGRVTATNRHEDRFSVAVPASGRFRLRVPAGTYVLVGRSPKFVSNGAPGTCRAGSVTVAAGRVVMRGVTCDGM
jgi:hypothetical protein